MQGIAAASLLCGALLLAWIFEAINGFNEKAPRPPTHCIEQHLPLILIPTLTLRFGETLYKELLRILKIIEQQ
jgi:hypothetical protein